MKIPASTEVMPLRRILPYCVLCVCVWPMHVGAVEGDRATHHSDHDEDIVVLPSVHVHGVPLNKDQQLGPVPTHMPWPAIPPALDGTVIDDWMKARFLVARDATIDVIVLEPCRHRELTSAGLAALRQWKFDPQMRGDEPVNGELTVRIHFRTQ